MQVMLIENYRDLIRSKIEENAEIKGYKSKIAKFLRIQASYFSQVMQGNADFTLDQASSLCDFFQFTDQEAEYFLTLVSLSRASTEKLRSRLRRKLLKIRQETDFFPVVKVKAFDLDFKNGVEYFNRWYFSAIHAALGLSDLSTASSISEALDLPVYIVEATLAKLEQMNIVRKQGNRWMLMQSELTTREESLDHLHHITMRLKAVDVFSNPRACSLRFTRGASFSKSDLSNIRQAFTDAIQRFERVSKYSTLREEVVCLNLDLLKLIQS